MEDDDDDDDDDDEAAIDLEARRWIGQHGTKAPEVLRQRVEDAEREGDAFSADAWRDIANAAERLLRQLN